MSGEHPYVSHQVAATSHYSLQASPTTGLHPVATGGSHLPGVSAPSFAYREDLSGNYGGHTPSSETMNGVAGPPHPHPHHHQYPYHEHLEQMPRGPPLNAGPPHWRTGYYGNQVPISSPDHENGNRMMQEAPPYSPHTTQYPGWDKPRTSFSRPPPGQDPNFAHPHNVTVGQKYTQSYARPPPHHQPVEPTAAPSPPTQYPGSPRTPLPHQPPPPLNGVSSQMPFGQPNPNHRSSLSMSAGPDSRDMRHYSDAHQPSPLRSPLDLPPTPQRVNGSQGGSVGQAYGPTNGQGGFGNGGNPYQHRRSQGSWDSHSADEAMPENRDNGIGRKYAGSDDGDKLVKREATSRSVSESLSPSNRRMTLGNSNDQRPSESSIKSENSGDQQPKKRGVAVFQDENGNEYYENEYVPLGVRIPQGWQRGTGKLTQDRLLPLTKDGIQVNAEWGFTAGGKARQRLPQACVNCRQKKIKCVETEYDELMCQHCTKMRIPCERSTKEEEKKKSKKIKSEHGLRSSSLASEDGNDQMGRNSSKKRKSSVDASQEYKRQNRQMGSRGGSRGGSMSRDPVDTGLANRMGHPPPPSSARTDSSRPEERAPMFATMDTASIAVEPPEDSSTKARHINELRENQFGPSSVHTLSDSSPRSFHATPAPSPTTPLSNSGGIILHNPTYDVAPRSQYSNSGSSSKETEGRSRSTPTTPHITHTFGEDPRHLDLPNLEMLDDLVESYFKNVYSQTYAFLHRRTFMQNLRNHPPVLLFSICAVAARFTEHKRLEEQFAVRARDLIMQQYDSYTIEVVQSMVNMGLHDFGSNNGQKAWMFCGMAIRMGAAMNMNLDVDKKGKIAQGSKAVISREEVRRTYWSYFLMDRFNNYGVARPYLIQDHDCHIQLPCNQPSFVDGTSVTTEYLISPNPRDPTVGTKYMGAMAFLVRIVGIWGNILRQIHLSGLPRAEGCHNGLIPPGEEFDYFINVLEKWRRSLPEGLTYSNENLAGQIKVGTTGAFVMMHVMWHTAMAYVHRYVRTVGLPKEEIKKRIANGFIVESIRKAFVHADAVLQIMYHVRQKKNADPENVTINAPFLGQAISDACHITITRAVEVRGELGGARDQKARVYVGLDWLKELKEWWKPVQQMHKDLKKRCQKLDINSSVPPSQRGHNVAPTPESSTDSAVPSGYQFSMDNGYVGDVSFGSEMGHSMDGYDVFPIPSFLSVGVPQSIYADAFSMSAQGTLFEYAGVEGAFPELYEPVSAGFVPNVTAAGQLSMMPSMHDPVMDQSFQSQNFSVPDADLSDNEYGIDSPGKDGGERRDIHATYFDPVAVHDGKLQDSASDTTESHSRRASEVSGNTKQSNPMDLFNLISNDVASDVQRTLPERHNDEFTGPGGAAAPESGDMGGGPMSLDNTEG